MFETLSRQQLNAMTSDAYKEAFQGPNGDDFRKRINELDSQPAQATTATRPHGSVRGPEAQTPASAQPFDPSFDLDDDQPASAAPALSSARARAEQTAPAAAPVAVQPAAVVEPSAELPEKIHEYQPVDRNGKKVGGLQRFKYRTDAELIQKLTAAHMASSARIRELSRDRKLDSIAAAGAAPRIQPEKEVPTTVEGLAAELRAQRESNFALSVRAAVHEFQASVDWTKYRSNENAKSVILAVERAADDPTDPASYQRAFHNMRDYLEPVSQPVAAPVPAVEPAPVAAPAPAPAVRNAQRAGISTGLSNADGGEDSLPAEPVRATVKGVKLLVDGKTQILDLRGWDRLSSEQQRRILKNPNNARAVDALYQEQQERKVAARGGR